MGRADGFGRILAMALFLGTASSALAAEDGIWSVSKSSGEVWISATGAQQVSLTQEATLKPGDTIRTGRNGRVLLVRGEETVLVSPNSVIGLPTEKKDGLSTTIVQQAGSILLEVEKRNVQHFEVETPYLAAVVKGTHFRVSVNAASTSVEVLRGQVEVADFKSGQIAQLMPGQVATAFAHGKAGLSLSGSGAFNPIERGRPRASSLERIPVPKTGLSAPRQAANGPLIKALGHIGASPHQTAGGASARLGVTRISAPLGELRLNFQKVTHGLARGSPSVSGSTRSAANKDTVWTSREGAATTSFGNGSGPAGSNNAGNTATSTSAAAISGATTSTAPVIAAAAENNSGNGNANGNGKHDGNNGNGGGNNGNGGGNGNNGNGHGHGH